MAITSAQCQTALGDGEHDAKILQAIVVPAGVATYQHWYVVGNQDAVGRARWCITTSSGNAAAQATEILDQLRA